MGLSECGHPFDCLHPSRQRQHGATVSLGHSNEAPRELCSHKEDEHANSLSCKQIEGR